jgi:serine/threonine-protein kinase
MGEVWRATDTKLDRDVAIKILPEAFAADADRMARFEREAKVLASLNHPNIAAIHGVEERALVMELVEGPTLAEHIAQGAMPLEEVLPVVNQLVDALEYAHERGVIHRDLKPANIKITPEGRVKVLDFGLAKAMSSETGATADLHTSPTLTMRATMAGVILGTAAYMSPEQARGQNVDRRADIWSFGVVLAELLTGRQLFTGPTISDTLAAVLTKEPDLSQVPAKVRRLLQSCLQKDPRQRLQSIGDSRLLLEDVAQPQPPPAVRSTLPWGAIAGALAVALALTVWVLWPANRNLQPLLRLDVDLGSEVSLGSRRGPDVVISPDGTRIVYCSHSRLFTRRLDQAKAVELAGTEGAWAPFFSPDGQWVAYFTPPNLKKVPVGGGAVIPLCNAFMGSGGTWGKDGYIVAALSDSGTLSRVPETGGEPTTLASLAPGNIAYRWPQLLPDGKTVLFTAVTSDGGRDGENVEVMSLRDGRPKMLQRGGAYARYLPSGHLVYLHRGTLFGVSVDLGRLETLGTPVPLLDEVAFESRYGSTQLDFSQTGMLVYRSGGAVANLVSVEWLDGNGRSQPLLAKPGEYETPRLSPDGNRMALSLSGDIWVYELRRETMTRLTPGDGFDTYPVWTPDGRYIAYRSRTGISYIRSDGSGAPQPLTKSEGRHFPTFFTADTKRLAFSEPNRQGVRELWTVPIETDGTGLRSGKPEAALQRMSSASSTSPDGRWLAYSSDESGTAQVYVQAFPEKDRKLQVSSGGGTSPVFSPKGGDLFFQNLENQIMVASYSVKGGAFTVGNPRLWSEKRLANLGAVKSYDVAPDGQRIVALVPPENPGEQKAKNHVIFLFNFFDELRRKVPLQ